jgi:hypothetical protein
MMTETESAARTPSATLNPRRLRTIGNFARSGARSFGPASRAVSEFWALPGTITESTAMFRCESSAGALTARS